MSVSLPLRVAQLGVAHSHAAGRWAALQPSYRSARWLTEAEQFGDGSIDAALAEAELSGLLGLGCRCLEAGKHLPVEKPPGVNLQAADGLVEDLPKGAPQSLRWVAFA